MHTVNVVFGTSILIFIAMFLLLYFREASLSLINNTIFIIMITAGIFMTLCMIMHMINSLIIVFSIILGL